MTPPPKSVRVIVWCGDTPAFLRSLGGRCERHKRASRASGVHVGQPAPKAASKVSHEACRSFEECVGSHASSQLRIATVRHGLKSSVITFSFSFCHVLVVLASHFRAGMDLPKKKVPLAVLFRSTRLDYIRFGRDSSHGKPVKIFYCRGNGRNLRKMATKTAKNGPKRQMCLAVS